MIDLLKIEVAKISRYRVFWILIGVYALLVPLGFLGVCNLIMEIQEPFGLDVNFSAFPKVWKFIAWTSAWWSFLLGILVIILFCNELTFRTQRQNIIDGMSRGQFVAGKCFFLSFLALMVSLYTTIVGAIFGLWDGGSLNFVKDIGFMGIYFIQTLGYFSVAFLFAVLFKKPALSIVFYILIWIINLFLSESATGWQFWPIDVISSMNPNPFFDEMISFVPVLEEKMAWIMPMSLRAILCLLYIVLFFGWGFLAIRKRDL